VLLAVFNDGAMIALSKDRVTPSPAPNSWRLRNIFAVGIVYGLYLTVSSWTLYHVGRGAGGGGVGLATAAAARQLGAPQLAARAPPLRDCGPSEVWRRAHAGAAPCSAPTSSARSLRRARAPPPPPQLASKESFFQDSVRLFSLNDTPKELVGGGLLPPCTLG
jgi:hypothetical protein